MYNTQRKYQTNLIKAIVKVKIVGYLLKKKFEVWRYSRGKYKSERIFEEIVRVIEADRVRRHLWRKLV